MIMTGTTFRVLGVRGTLGLLALAGVLLPVGATWAQQPKEPQEIKVQIKTDTVVDGPVVADVKVREEQEPVVVWVNTAGTVQQVVADRVQGRIDLGGKVIVSDSRDDVIKALEEQIAALKRGAAPDAEVAPERIKALVRIIDELKKTPGAAREPEVKTFHYYGVKEAKAAQAAGDAAKIEELNKELARIKGTLETSLKELKATQEKIRKLGGDPGETPVVTWRRLLDKTQKTVYRTYAYTTPGTVTVVNPAKPQEAPKVREVQVMTLEPDKTAGTPTVDPRRTEFLTFKLSADELAQVRKLMDEALAAYKEGKLVEAAALATKAAEIDPNELAAKMLAMKARMERQFREKAKTDGGGTVDPDRLELLEKRLKALQEEVNGMKKGSK